MENNRRYVQKSTLLHEGAADLAARCVEPAQALLAGAASTCAMARGGRKAHELERAE